MKKTMSLFQLVCLFLFLNAIASVGSNGSSQATTAFSGIPIIKISEGGVERVADKLNRSQSVNLGCVISRINNKYYWATRENKLLIRIEGGGSFTTYVAGDGSGYVRVINAEDKKTLSIMGGTEAHFDYVEHLLIGLKSVTYYGRAK